MSDAPSGIKDLEVVDAESPSAYPPSIQAGLPKLGITPKGWTRFPLGALLRRIERPAKLVDTETYQLVTAKRNRGGIVARENLRGDQIRTKTQFYVETGDFLISNRQISHGACGVVPAELHRAVVSNEYTAFHTSDVLDPRFLNALSHSVYFQQTCFHSSIGVHVEKLVFRLEDWLNWEFDIPPFSEQRRIVAVLDAWDRAIDQTEALVDAKRKAYRSELSRIANWSEDTFRRLDEVANVNLRSLSGKTPPDFEFDYFDIAAAEDGSEEELSGRICFKDAPSRARRMVANEGVVYSTVRPLLRRLFIAKRRDDAVYSTGYSILEPKDCCLVGYLKHALVSNCVERQIYARLTGSGYPAINEDDLAEVKIPFLNKERQIQVCETLDGLESERSLYFRYSNALRAQKRGLMQKLLGGQWRLDERFDPSTVMPRIGRAVGAA